MLALAAGCASRETAVEHPNFSGIYRPAGLEVQPCGRNEWMRRSFETDTFCNGDDSAFPFTAAGLERWKSYEVIDDPVLGCVEDFPRNAMRGRPMRITLGEEITDLLAGARWVAAKPVTKPKGKAGSGTTTTTKPVTVDVDGDGIPDER